MAKNELPGTDDLTVESTVRAGSSSITAPVTTEGKDAKGRPNMVADEEVSPAVSLEGSSTLSVDDLLSDVPSGVKLPSGPEATEAAADELRDDEQATVLVHFVVDGHQALEQTWYRGQELELAIDGSDRWFEHTKDRNGDSWLLYSEEDQVRKWGHVVFRPGPWPFDPSDDERVRDAEAKRARRPLHPAPGSIPRGPAK